MINKRFIILAFILILAIFVTCIFVFKSTFYNINNNLNLNANKKNNINIIELGTKKTGSTVQYNQLVAETCEKSYKIVGKSCRCVDAELKENEAGELFLTIQLQVNTPGLQHSEVLIAEDGSNNIITYRFQVCGTDGMKINPRKGYFEVNGDQSTYQVTLDYYTADSNITANFEGIETNIQGLNYGTVIPTIIHSRIMTIHRFEISLLYQSDDNLLPNIINKKVNFLIETSNGKNTLPFELTIQSLNKQFQLTPEKILLTQSKSNMDMSGKTVKLSFSTDKIITRVSLQQEVLFPIKVTTQSLSSNEYAIHVDIIPDRLKEMLKGLHKTSIEIYQEDGFDAEPINLPIALMIYD